MSHADSRLPPTRSRPRLLAVLACAVALGLSGCDELGLETPGKVAQKKEADGRAIGSACRHAVRSIEDCYASNPKASKAAVFEGWREMDAYMRENDIAGMPASPPAVAATLSPKEEVVAPAAPGAPAASNTPGNGQVALPSLPGKPNIAPAGH